MAVHSAGENTTVEMTSLVLTPINKIVPVKNKRNLRIFQNLLKLLFIVHLCFKKTLETHYFINLW